MYLSSESLFHIVLNSKILLLHFAPYFSTDVEPCDVLTKLGPVCGQYIFSNCKFWCTWFILPVLFTVMKILDSVPENLCGLEVDSLVLPILQILSLPSADADTGSPNPAVSLSAKILKIIEKKIEKPGLMKAQVRLLLIMILSYECYNV